jgi:hypothetical protein
MRPMRVQLKRKKGWRMPENTVSVARPTRWGNPYKVVKLSGELWTVVQASNGEPVPLLEIEIMAEKTAHYAAIGLFNSHVNRRMVLIATPYPAEDEIRAELEGKHLACWCRLCSRHQKGKPVGVKCTRCQPCHADVLLEVANRPPTLRLGG